MKARFRTLQRRATQTKRLPDFAPCSKCGERRPQSDLHYYVDGNNFAITNSAKPVCGACK